MKYSIRQNHLNKTMLFEDGIQVRQPSASEIEFWARIKELEKEVQHWKSNHDEQVRVKKMLLDRPDLKDRAKSIQKLEAEISSLKKLYNEAVQCQ